MSQPIVATCSGVAVWFSERSHRPVCKPVEEGWCLPPLETELQIFVLGVPDEDGRYRAIAREGKGITLEIAQELLDSVSSEIASNPTSISACQFRHPSGCGAGLQLVS